MNEGIADCQLPIADLKKASGSKEAIGTIGNWQSAMEARHGLDHQRHSLRIS
jgi:hypothetical protein